MNKDFSRLILFLSDEPEVFDFYSCYTYADLVIQWNNAGIVATIPTEQELDDVYNKCVFLFDYLNETELLIRTEITEGSKVISEISPSGLFSRIEFLKNQLPILYEKDIESYIYILSKDGLWTNTSTVNLSNLPSLTQANLDLVASKYKISTDEELYKYGKYAYNRILEEEFSLTESELNSAYESVSQDVVDNIPTERVVLEGDTLKSSSDLSPITSGATIGDKLSDISGHLVTQEDTDVFLQSQIDDLNDVVAIENYPFYSYHFASNFSFDVTPVLVPLVTPQIFIATVGSGHPLAWHNPSSMNHIVNGHFIIPNDGFYQIETTLTIDEVAEATFERGVVLYFDVSGIFFEVQTANWLKKENGESVISAVGTIPMIAGSSIGLLIEGVNVQNPSSGAGQINLKVKSGFATITRVYNSNP